MAYTDYENRGTPSYNSGQLVSFVWKGIHFCNERIKRVSPYCKGSFYNEPLYEISGAIKLFWEHELQNMKSDNDEYMFIKLQ